MIQTASCLRASRFMGALQKLSLLEFNTVRTSRDGSEKCVRKYAGDLSMTSNSTRSNIYIGKDKAGLKTVSSLCFVQYA